MARDIGQKIIKEAMDKFNNFKIAVTGGSKGDYFNITQTASALGQQNLKEGRVRLMLDGKRTLPHYPYENVNVREYYESRGFILNSLTEGLNPKDFFFYAMSGREGICDITMGTSVSGYIQRKLVKLMEDLQVQHDYTVRDSNNDIIQFSYGDNSIACNKMVLIKTPTDEQNNEGKTIYKKKTYLMDVNNLVERINLDYELENDTFNLKNIIQFIIQDIFKNNINDRKSLIQSLQENQTFNFTFNRHVKYINNLIDLFSK